MAAVAVAAAAAVSRTSFRMAAVTVKRWLDGRLGGRQGGRFGGRLGGRLGGHDIGLGRGACRATTGEVIWVVGG